MSADPDTDLAACAGLVARGDPSRFRATMAAPVALRRILLPLYAFNLEVARAPWVTKEPLIAEMRLQWWRDALGEIAAGGRVRRHEVVTPLTDVLDAQGARDLDDLIAARGADIEAAGFATRDDLLRYVDRTAGTLLWTAARLAGAEDAPAIRDAGLAQGLAAWLRAGPDLASRGRRALPGDAEQADEATRALAEIGLKALDRAEQARHPKPVRQVLLVLSDTRAELRAFRARPGQTPDLNPALSRLRLGWRALRA